MFAIVLSIHIIICAFLIIMILLQRSEGGGLGIGQTGSGGGLGDYLSARSTSNILTKTTSFLALCFFLTSFSLVLISNKEIDEQSANEMNSLFFEVIMAPSYSTDALEILKGKKVHSS